MSSHATQIGLLQHGATDAGDVFCGSYSTALSKQGWKYLKQAFGKSKPDWDIVITSPQKQCAAFAEWYSGKHHLPCHTEERLREIHYGEWEGNSPSQVMQSHPNILAQWWANPAQAELPAGEEFAEFRYRVLEAWDEIKRQYRDKRILLVTHANVIRVITAEVLGMPDNYLFALNREAGGLVKLRVFKDRSGEWTNLISYD